MSKEQPRGMGRVYRPSRKCPTCNAAGCSKCTNGRRHSKTWTIQFSHRNKQYRECSGFTRKGDAVKLLKKRMAEAGKEKRVAGREAEKLTFEDLAQIIRDDYRINGRKTGRRIEISIKRLSELFAGMRALDITPDLIRRYVAMRLEAGIANATVRNETNVLRRAFRLAHEAGRIGDVPHFPLIRMDNVRTGFFERDDFEAVLAGLPAPVRAVAEFGYLSGWRLGEILGLRWTQVDFTAGVIRLEVGSTKNSDGRTLPFTVLPSLRTLMEDQLAYTQAVEKAKQRVVPWVFHRNGREIKTIARAWEKACEAAGCPDRLFHDLRRTAVRNLERAGVPRSIAMKITGHRTEAIYRRYAIVNENDIAEGLGKLASFLEGEGRRAEG